MTALHPNSVTQHLALSVIKIFSSAAAATTQICSSLVKKDSISLLKRHRTAPGSRRISQQNSKEAGGCVAQFCDLQERRGAQPAHSLELNTP